MYAFNDFDIIFPPMLDLKVIGGSHFDFQLLIKRHTEPYKSILRMNKF